MNQENAINTILEYKNKIKFFTNLEDNEIKILLKDVTFKKYMQHETIFFQGEDKDDYIYYILKGYANINIKDTNKSLKTIASLHSGSLIGEMKPILNEGRTANCVAGNSGAVVIGFVINHDYIDKYPKAYAKFYKNMSYILAQKIQDTNQKVRSFK